MAKRPDIEIAQDFLNGGGLILNQDLARRICNYALALEARNAILESQITKKQELIEELEQTIAALEE